MKENTDQFIKLSRRISNGHRFRQSLRCLLLLSTAALINLTVGTELIAASVTDVFFGTEAGASITTGTFNTGVGYNALNKDDTGSGNTAGGAHALENNTSGGDNTACGAAALFNNTSGVGNTAVGVAALVGNSTGVDNTATGNFALQSNTNAKNNTANGFDALFSNTMGNNNTAVGFFSLFNNVSGNSNVAIGVSAGQNLTTGSNNIDIGNAGVAGESNTLRIGTKGTHKNTFIAGISGTIVPNGVGVIVGTGGKLGTIVSSARFKEKIRPMDESSEAILALKPVSFYYKHELDHDATPQFGLVAEEVEKVKPALVVHDDEGKPYTVRYEAINAMLLNEFLKEHRKVESQNKRVEQLEATVTRLESALETQAAQIQKVTTHLEMKNSRVPLLAHD